MDYSIYITPFIYKYIYEKLLHTLYIHKRLEEEFILILWHCVASAHNSLSNFYSILIVRFEEIIGAVVFHCFSTILANIKD